MGLPIDININLDLSCHVSEVLELLYAAESHFFHTPNHSGQNFGRSLWRRSMMLESAESEHPRPTDHEIIFEEFQPM